MKDTAARLLIVDDEPDLREVLQMILADLDAEVLTAENGVEALAILQKQKIHAVVSDINMPLMNGLELLKEVRQSGLDVPFVFVTAFGEKKNLLEALRWGATDFIDKPFNSTVIHSTMEKALQLGLAMEQVQMQLDEAFRSSNLPTQEILRLKNMKRAIIMMQLECEIYARKRLSVG